MRTSLQIFVKLSLSRATNNAACRICLRVLCLYKSISKVLELCRQATNNKLFRDGSAQNRIFETAVRADKLHRYVVCLDKRQMLFRKTVLRKIMQPLKARKYVHTVLQSISAYICIKKRNSAFAKLLLVMWIMDILFCYDESNYIYS